MSVRESTGFSEQGIRSIIIPAGQCFFLLPNVAIAEIISLHGNNPVPVEEAPNWLIGYLNWRGVKTPIISWEGLVENQKPNLKDRKSRIAILNTLNGNPELSHIGLFSSGVTRLARVRADTIKIDEAATLSSPFIKASVTVTDLPALIPDLDELERKVMEIHIKFK